jgi:phage terminase large subunit-like protein
MKSWPPRWLTPIPDEALENSHGKKAIDFINAFAIVTKDSVGGKAGEPMRLRDWQEQLLLNAFAADGEGFRHKTILVGQPRKNGKSALASGVALWSLLTGPKGGEVYSCAADKDQARIVFGEAKKMLTNEPELEEMAKIYRDAIEIPSTGSVYRVLSAEAFTKEGLSPTMVIFDELHAQPDRTLFDVMQLAQGARGNLATMFCITTAGQKSDNTGKDSIAYSLYQYGQRVARGEVEDPSFFMAWYEAAAEADHKLEETWIAANPGYGDLNSVDDFKSTVLRTPEAEFRTKRCNQWVSSNLTWLPTGSWDQLSVEQQITPDDELIIGFDGSFSGDTTVLVGCTIPKQEEELPHIFLIKAWEKGPDDDNSWRVNITDVENEIISFCQQYPKVREIACDPYRWQRTMAYLLEERQLPIVEFPSTSPARMVKATARFFDGVMEGKMTHSGDPLLARHLDNCVLKIDNIGPRIVKENRNSNRRIDAAVAAVIAYERATVGRMEEVVPQIFV